MRLRQLYIVLINVQLAKVAKSGRSGSTAELGRVHMSETPIIYQSSPSQYSPVGAQVPDDPPPSTRARRFVLTWDNSRAKRPGKRDLEKQQAEGVQFGNGFVALDNGRGFESLFELETVLGLAGHYAIAWCDA